MRTTHPTGSAVPGEKFSGVGEVSSARMSADRNDGVSIGDVVIGIVDIWWSERKAEGLISSLRIRPGELVVFLAAITPRPSRATGWATPTDCRTGASPS